MEEISPTESGATRCRRRPTYRETSRSGRDRAAFRAKTLSPPGLRSPHSAEGRSIELFVASLDGIEVARPLGVQATAQWVVVDRFGRIGQRRRVTPPDIQEPIDIPNGRHEIRPQEELSVIGDDAVRRKAPDLEERVPARHEGGMQERV